MHHFPPLQALGVAAVNTLIAAFLSAIGVGTTFVDNLVTSQCIGLLIYAGCVAALRFAPTPRMRDLGAIAAVPAGATAGVGLSVALLGERHEWLSAMAWQSVLIGLTFGGAISTMFYLRHRMSQLESKLRERELRDAVAEKEQIGAQLRMLQAQIEPHFLFNTLAHLSALTRSDPGLADRMLGDLIGYLRVSLRRTRGTESTLGDEAELLRAYLDIIALRLGPRLQWSLDVPDELLGRSFPPLLLQPLVENAVTHGIETKVGGGTVAVSASIADGRLRLCVTDTGHGLSDTANGSGLGLDNVRQRLQTLYGNAGALKVRENPEGGVTATIEVPA